ncbi:MAG: formylglycine-generating enzyme family protein [Proteobacteria bacterium]|nr:formylglycine-generating enzyme family protein [Pseudomonadota bacterium]
MPITAKHYKHWEHDKEYSEEAKQEAEDLLSGTGKVPMNEQVPIKGGEFTMGTDNLILPQDGEGPARKVKLISHSQFQL